MANVRRRRPGTRRAPPAAPVTTTGGRALVLGGGGIAGIAWETGVLAGLAEQGVDLTGADRVVGTSAGSTVGAQITSGTALDELFARQVDGAVDELVSDVPAAEAMAGAVKVLTEGGALPPPAEARRRLARLGLEVPDTQWEARRRVIAARLEGRSWPERDLRLVVVDADTGEDAVLTRDSGFPLVDAVAASSAVPGVWPAVVIGDHRYVDGGLRSSTNEDLALGCSVVVVLAPGTAADFLVTPEVAAGVQELHRTAQVLVVRPDEASTAAFGPDSLDPATRGPSARAGREQGRALGPAVAEVWAAG